MKLAAYVRVSTDDKGQRPERQRELLEAWADAAGHCVVAWGIDEGTSASKTNPFERPAFNELVSTGLDRGALAVVVESPDRLTRQGTHEHGWAVVELQRRHGLQLICADIPEGETGDLLEAFKAFNAKEKAQRLSAATKTGMESSGNMGGRPRKIDKELVRQVLHYHAEGLGTRRIAHEVSRERGAFEVADASAQRRLRVSRATVRRVLDQAGQNPNRAKTSPSEHTTAPDHNGTLLAHPEGVPP